MHNCNLSDTMKIMDMLQRTTTTSKHWHLVYRDPVTGKLVTSMDKGHTHILSEYPDPINNEILRIAVGAAETDNHTHEIEALQPPIAAKPEDQEEVAVTKHVVALFQHAIKIEEPSRKKGFESVEFFKGEQWDAKEKSALNAKARASQVYNYTQAFIDSLSGLARQSRLNPRAFPIEGSDDGVADVVTSTLTWVSKRSNLPQQEIRVFEDMVITGRGLFHVDISQKRNVLGDAVIERFPWADGYFGVHNELDASDATHMHKAKWVSLQEAKARYPHLAEELEGQLKSSDTYPEEISERVALQRLVCEDQEIIDKDHQRLRLVEHEIKETRVAYIVMDMSGQNKQEVDATSFRKAETIPGINLIEVPRERIRVVVTVGSLLLRNYYPDRPYEGFSLVPVYAYKSDDNDWWGKVEAMKDAQREINKRGSQAIDIVNRMLGQGWFYDDDTFADEKDKNRFQQDAGKPGFTAKIANTDRPPAPVEHPPFPTELLSLHRQNVDIIQSVSNIPPAMMGSGSGYESAQALQTQRSSGLVGNERIFDNMILSKQTVFQKVFRIVQKFYSKERIARLVLSSASDPTRMENMQIGAQEIPIQRPPEADIELAQYIVKMLETVDLDEYDIAIGEQPLSPTAREAQFRLWLEASNHGMQVPPALLMDLSSLPNKGKWAREMQAMQQATMQMEQQKFAAEMAKAGRIPVNNNGGNS